MLLKVRVVLKASRNQVVGWENEHLKIRLHAVAEKGKANEELLKFLSSYLQHPISKFSIIRGKISRLKVLNIDDLEEETVRNLVEKNKSSER